MKPLKIFGVTVVAIILDQISKVFIHNSMQLYQSFPVWGNFFRITYIENSGMAFGIKLGQNAFFTVFAVIASLAIMAYLYKMKGERFIARFSMALILGGAIGNLWDRITRGSVVDFLDFEFFDVNIPAFKLLFLNFPGYTLDRWPVFNVADIAITVGMLLLVAFVMFEKEQPAPQKMDAEMIH
ncbi:MAG: signal peptidase II [Calditrichaeota bacterium]|nr:MAG: signal peptidase II [Calditrichota bacterium]